MCCWIIFGIQTLNVDDLRWTSIVTPWLALYSGFSLLLASISVYYKQNTHQVNSSRIFSFCLSKFAYQFTEIIININKYIFSFTNSPEYLDEIENLNCGVDLFIDILVHEKGEVLSRVVFCLLNTKKEATKRFRRHSNERNQKLKAGRTKKSNIEMNWFYWQFPEVPDNQIYVVSTSFKR